MLNIETKNKIKDAFKNKQLFVKSSSEDKKVEWKLINDVLKHNIKDEKVYYVKTESKKEIRVTGSHSLFVIENNKIKATKTKDLKDKLVIVENENVIEEKIVIKEITKYEQFMYDLSVENNHNFVISNGILAHNSYAPPKSECAVAGYTERHGYLWTDEELMEYLYIGVQQVNMLPKAPKFHSLESIYQDKLWIPLLKSAAAIWALTAIATNWAEESFNYSLNGISLELDKFDKYMQLKANLEERFDKLSERYIQKNNMMLGIRPSAYSLGIGRGGSGLHLGPYTTGLNPANYIRALSLTGFKFV